VRYGYDIAAAKVKPDRGAFAGLADDIDIAAHLAHQPVHLGKPEAGALARRLGGEEGVEGARDHFGRHAGSGIADRHQHAPFVDWVAGRGDGERSAVRHRVAGIDAEVEDADLELIAVGDHDRRARVELHLDRYAGAERLVEEFVHVPDRAIDVDRAGRKLLGPRERQKLRRQFRAALGRLERVFGELGDAGLGGAGADQVEIADQ